MSYFKGNVGSKTNSFLFLRQIDLKGKANTGADCGFSGRYQQELLFIL